ncbi:hypothetical protein IC575_009544 [Cucumis melo]
MAVFSENLLKIGCVDEGKEFLFLQQLKWRNRASLVQFTGFHGGLKRKGQGRRMAAENRRVEIKKVKRGKEDNDWRQF